MLEKKEKYDPTVFVIENIHKILPENSILIKVSFSGHIKRLFHTNNRPNGIVTIFYRQNIKTQKMKLFVKQHHNAQAVFEQMRINYKNLTPKQANKNLPRPIICDPDHDANFMEYFKGINLKYVIFRELTFLRKNKLCLLFNSIGNWLHEYHIASVVSNKTSMGDIKLNILDALNRSTIFKESDKKKIIENITKINFFQNYFELIKPHNDFALRNIICIDSSNFVVIDWDAMFHDKFPSEAPIWNDITSFFINILSLSRFSPLVSKQDKAEMINSFLSGYFKNFDEIRDEVNNFLLIFTLSFYLGIIGDRPIPEIYKTKRGIKFINSLQKKFIQGKII